MIISFVMPDAPGGFGGCRRRADPVLRRDVGEKHAERRRKTAQYEGDEQ
jgi:hypothetical protein